MIDRQSGDLLFAKSVEYPDARKVELARVPSVEDTRSHCQGVSTSGRDNSFGLKFRGAIEVDGRLARTASS